MSTQSTIRPPIFDRIRREQVIPWIFKRQQLDPQFASLNLSAQCLSIYAMSSGNLLLTLDWSGEQITAFERHPDAAPYRFTAMPNALVFLDAILLHHAMAFEKPAIAEQPLPAVPPSGGLKAMPSASPF